MSVAQSRIAGTFAYFGWTLALAIYATAIWYFPVPGIEKSYIVQLSINSTEHVQVDLGLFRLCVSHPSNVSLQSCLDSFGLPNDKDPLQFASSFIQNMHLENLPSHEYNKTLSALLDTARILRREMFQGFDFVAALASLFSGGLFLVFPVFFNPRHRYAICGVLMAASALSLGFGLVAAGAAVSTTLRTQSLLTTPDSLTINLGTGPISATSGDVLGTFLKCGIIANGVFVVLVVVAAFLRDGRIFTTTKDRGDDPSDTELRPPPAYGTSEGNLLDQAKADKPNVVTG
ncbi:hypothetical protein EDB80DRAFT_900691 [Ilyonectria destructans]|nr:hypothetical protein EDB80DRAFT_900691 [Ilyonectria destructans]